MREHMTRNRDLLWAEASYFEATGESPVLPKHLWLSAEDGQRERLIDDPLAGEARKPPGGPEP